jgi:ribonuclease G
MAKNILVISVDLRETRVALIEDGIIAELHIERGGNKSSTVGNVYLGKVTRVLPGLQAAFIDIGQERAAFLHVEDLIRPDDFETYLQGGRKKDAGDSIDDAEATSADDDDEVVVAAPAHRLKLPESKPKLLPDAATSAPNAAETPSSEAQASHSTLPNAIESEGVLIAPPAESSAVMIPDDRPSEVRPLDLQLRGALEKTTEDEPESGPLPTDDEIIEAADSDREEAQDLDDERDALDGDDDVESKDDAPAELDPEDPESVVATSEDDLFDLPGFTVSEVGDPVPRAPAPTRDDRRGRGRGRRGRGRDGKRGGREGAREGGREAKREGGREGSRDGRARRPDPTQANRISKSTPIREVVQEGQDVIVQVSKDPISTKGARCTSHISLPGRYVVYLPTVDHVGISKRIGSDKERARLRETIEAMKPPTGGLVVRTVAEGLTKKQLKQDVGYLVRLWGEVAKNREGKKSPSLLMSELDLVLKVARDLFTDEVEKIIIDDKQQYDRLVHFIEMFAPERAKDIELYTGAEPLFDGYGIEGEIQRALARKVPLPSGGYLIIDQAEALTAIDVNTGRFVGKGSKDMEETILKTNLEAVTEIAYQLRFRNIGGLIILDLIDMEKSSNREKVRRTLEELLTKDKAKTTLNRISDLGLIEMTRKRTRESLGRYLHEPCFYCDGTGQLQSKETIAYEILREIRRKHKDLPGYTIQLSAHPAVVDLLQGDEKAAIADVENRYMRKVVIVPRKDYHLEQFDISGR